MLNVLAYTVTVVAMTIHDSKHPELIDLSEVFKNNKGVLVNFVHVGHITCSSFCRNSFNYIIV